MQALEKVRQPAIAEPHVIGAAARGPKRETRAGLEAEVDLVVEPVQHEGLQIRRAHFDERDRRQDENQRGRDREPPEPRPQAQLPLRGRPGTGFDALGGDGSRQHRVHDRNPGPVARNLGGELRPPSEASPRRPCEPQDVAGLGPRRPRRAARKSEPQDVAGLGPRRPRRAARKSEPQDVAGLGSRRPRRAARKSEPQDVAGLGSPRPRRADLKTARAAGRLRAGPEQRSEASSRKLAPAKPALERPSRRASPSSTGCWRRRRDLARRRGGRANSSVEAGTTHWGRTRPAPDTRDPATLLVYSQPQIPRRENERPGRLVSLSEGKSLGACRTDLRSDAGLATSRVVKDALISWRLEPCSWASRTRLRGRA